jgi:antitoxin (DNA-binding transcriptional repressor) of toxin-antitoxin stability system
MKPLVEVVRKGGEIDLIVHSGNVASLAPAEAEELRRALVEAAVVVGRLTEWLGP